MVLRCLDPGTTGEVPFWVQGEAPSNVDFRSTYSSYACDFFVFTPNPKAATRSLLRSGCSRFSRNIPPDSPDRPYTETNDVTNQQCNNPEWISCQGQEPGLLG